MHVDDGCQESSVLYKGPESDIPTTSFVENKYKTKLGFPLEYLTAG
jgi:hypothetical protein